MEDQEFSKMPFQLTSIDLPQCVISTIFSKLSMKAMVRTSILSKQWVNEWKSIKSDLNFDFHNMFEIQEIKNFNYFLNYSSPKRRVKHHLWFNSEFIRRVDHFMLPQYQRAKIHSLKVDFPLGDREKNAIDRWISQGVAKDVERIELLFYRKETFINVDFDPQLKLYEFSFNLLSGCASIKFLHLQKCVIVSPPIDLSGLKNLITLVLEKLTIQEDLLPTIFLECLQLKNLTFNECSFMSNLIIRSPILCHLNILGCIHKHHLPWNMDIDTLNLSYFEYRGGINNISSINAPRLFKLYMDSINETMEETKHVFTLIGGLPQLQNLTMFLTDNLPMIKLPNDFTPFYQLKQLELFHCEPCSHEEDFLWILDIVMACPHLQRFSLMLLDTYSPRMRQRREHMGFFHNELKYVEFHGCAGGINEIELAGHFLRNVNSLKQITFTYGGKCYMGGGSWIDLDHSCFSDWYNSMQEMLKDEVDERIQLIIL